MKYTTVCKTCEKEFTRGISRKRYEAGQHPIYCSRECVSNDISRNIKKEKVPNKLCKICGKSFYSKNSSQKCCSRECGNISRTKEKVYKECLFCGKPFEIKDHKEQMYCSKRCFYDSKIKSTSRKKKTEIKEGVFNCEQCGKEYTLPRTGKNKYVPQNLCSYQCRADFFGYSNPDNKKIYICDWCGKEFESWTYRNCRFCSRWCMSKFAAIQPKPNKRKPENYVTLNCKICGKEYRIHKIFLNRTHKNGNVSTSSYCSIECQAKAKSESMKGENNPNYVDGSSRAYCDRGENWDRQKRKALKRDGDTCQECGIKKGNDDGIIIDVHHYTPYRLFEGDYIKANELSNLITLCRNCHAKVEHEFRKNN